VEIASAPDKRTLNDWAHCTDGETAWRSDGLGAEERLVIIGGHAMT
jgi:hypothetical protein